MLAQRERARLDHHVVVGRHRLARAPGLAQLGPEADRLLHVDLGVQGEVGDRRLRLRHPLGDLDLDARGLHGRDDALGAARSRRRRGRRLEIGLDDPPARARAGDAPQVDLRLARQRAGPSGDALTRSDPLPVSRALPAATGAG